MKREIILKILDILIILFLILFINNNNKSIGEYYFMTKVDSNNEYYNKSIELLNKFSLEEKIKELIIARFNDDTIIENYGGYIFFEDDFKGKTKDDVINMIKIIQDNKQIKCLTMVDEEGGSVVRISSNRKISDYTFKSSQELYKNGGLAEIVNDVYVKSKLLEELGINVNLAPVVDVSTNKLDYMYKRSFGSDANMTSIYAKTVIEASNNTNVTYTLKHFPGYGNNSDTHKGISIDTRSYEEIMNKDILPFKSGIESGAKLIMVSHNVVTSIDDSIPASLSINIHKLLREDLNYQGLIITDDLSMKALDDIENKCVLAINSGNDLIITREPQSCAKEIANGINNGLIKKEVLDNIVLGILELKYEKGLIED